MEIITEAREWIDTPYRHQHSTKGQGCDCLGLLRGVWREVIGPEPKSVPNYTPSWDEAKGSELLLNTARELFTEVSDIEPGAALVFRMRQGAVAKHCGIAIDENTMIHAYQPDRVVETPLTRWWKRKIVYIGTFPVGE
jgi:NlpC/P60 family putative phage cell wall peptidase